ncbi:hypothetical protein [Sphingobacterium sp. IITKGP-BTPF85]|uniref:hypothetical protein n=1 Tax=Sphingobacterium sp. IITKGP-BTPF85 TaxID=1338009 RepID=UPI000389EACC|nr:hypothetical protein [Sphingobacterium sp. IITKGP-BTPF85]KKX50400.1 hypothetical protein L950_0210725 [Sphingobacterium sp. IITKGP-BTPF85]
MIYKLIKNSKKDELTIKYNTRYVTTVTSNDIKIVLTHKVKESIIKVVKKNIKVGRVTVLTPLQAKQNILESKNRWKKKQRKNTKIFQPSNKKLPSNKKYHII